MNIIRDLGPDPVGVLLSTGYHRFASDAGIHGLFKADGKRLDLLAVDATRPGTGQFRDFMQQCKCEYDTICVWAVWNVFLPDVLARYGFTATHQNEWDGERMNGFRWDRP